MREEWEIVLHRKDGRIEVKTEFGEKAAINVMLQMYAAGNLDSALVEKVTPMRTLVARVPEFPS